VCLPLLILPCTIKSRSSHLAPAHPDGPRKRAVKWLWSGGGDCVVDNSCACFFLLISDHITLVLLEMKN